MSRARALAALAVFVATGCHFGSRMEKLPTARGPLGATVRLVFDRQVRVPGELLSVSDTAFLVRKVDGTLTLALYRRISSVAIDHLGAEYMFVGGRQRLPDAVLRGRWRLVARYPQGLPPDQLAQLMLAGRQAALEIR